MAVTPSIEEEAIELVRRMSTDYGATFHVHSGIGAEPERWTYEAAPGLLPSARKHLKTIDRQRPGFDAAMVASIRTLRPGDAT